MKVSEKDSYSWPIEKIAVVSKSLDNLSGALSEPYTLRDETPSDEVEV